MGKKSSCSCKVGRSRFAEVINSLRDQHYSMKMIYGWCVLNGISVSIETIIKHFREHYLSDPERQMYVPTCKVCSSQFLDDFDSKYLRGDPVDTLRLWLNKSGLNTTVANVKNHIQHRALDKLAKKGRNLLLEQPVDTDIEELVDARVDKMNPSISKVIDIKEELRNLIFIKKDRVHRRQQLDAHVPTPDTRRELESLEKTLMEYNKITQGDVKDITHKQAGLVGIMTKQLNIVLGDLDATKIGELAYSVREKLQSLPVDSSIDNDKSIPLEERTDIIVNATKPSTPLSDITALLSHSKEVIIDAETAN